MLRSICVVCLLVNLRFVSGTPVGYVNKEKDGDTEVSQNEYLNMDVSKQTSDSYPSHLQQSRLAGKLGHDPYNIHQEMKRLIKKVLIKLNSLHNSSVFNNRSEKNLNQHAGLKNESTRILNNKVLNISAVRQLQSDSNTGINLARAESLQQGEGSDVPEHIQSPAMVLTIASSVVIFFSMSSLVALFLCCCKKKRRSTASERKDGDEKADKNTEEKIEKESEEKKSTDVPNKDIIEKPKEKNEKPKDDKSDDEEQQSVKNRLRAFEKKERTPSPSPKPSNVPRKRPQSEAFKAFESKGIIMGMGKSPLLPRAREKKDENENQDEKLDESPAKATTVPLITVADDSKAEEDMDSSYVQPENPDVVIADEDDDSEFGVIKRETEVLRSYRKAPPPKNRNRSSAAFRRKRAQESMGSLINEEKDNSEETESLLKPENNDSTSSKTKNKENDKKDIQNVKSSKGTPEKTKEKSRSKTPEPSGTNTPQKSSAKSSPEKQLKSSPEKQLKSSPEKQLKSSPKPSKSKTEAKDASPPETEKPPEKESFPPGGNIFLQIDPTVRKKSPDVKPKSPSGGRSKLDIQSREEKTKSSPNILKDDDVMQALAEQIKAKKEGSSDGKQNKAYNRRSLDTFL